MREHNIKALPNNGFAPSNESISGHLREQAEFIETSDEGIRNVYMIIERSDGSMYKQTMGKPCDLARVIGVMTMAAVRASMGEDE